jgi:hypothetical protein
MDDIILLAPGGKMIYCGPIAKIERYFDEVGYPCPTKANPADFVMDVLSGLGECVRRTSVTNDLLIDDHDNHHHDHDVKDDDDTDDADDSGVNDDHGDVCHQEGLRTRCQSPFPPRCPGPTVRKPSLNGSAEVQQYLVESWTKCAPRCVQAEGA